MLLKADIEALSFAGIAGTKYYDVNGSFIAKVVSPILTTVRGWPPMSPSAPGDEPLES